MKLLFISFIAILVNLPFGWWRQGLRKRSLLWFIAIHAPIPLVIGLRLLLDISWQPIIVGLLVLACLAGQLAGGWIRKRRVLNRLMEQVKIMDNSTRLMYLSVAAWLLGAMVGWISAGKLQVGFVVGVVSSFLAGAVLPAIMAFLWISGLVLGGGFLAITKGIGYEWGLLFIRVSYPVLLVWGLTGFVIKLIFGGKFNGFCFHFFTGKR